MRKCFAALLCFFLLSITASGLTVQPTLNYSVNQSFNGSQGLDKSSDLDTVKSLSTGSIYAKFKTGSSASAQTIISASDKGDPSSNVTLAVNGGGILHYENRENGSYSVKLDAGSGYNDGQWHQVILVVDSSGTKLYMDGYLVTESSDTGFFNSVSQLDALYIGQNIDSSGPQWHYEGDIDTVEIYSSALSDDQVKEKCGIPVPLKVYEPTTVFNNVSDAINVSNDIGDVESLNEGAVFIKFKTTSNAAAQAMFSASDASDPSSNFTFSVNGGGKIYAENRENGSYAFRFNAPTTGYNDGNWHTATLVVNNQGSSIYVDGSLAKSVNDQAFFSNVTEMDSMFIGKNIDSSNGDQWGFTGEIQRVEIYNEPLNAAQVKDLSDHYLPIVTNEPIKLFYSGYDNSANYRIPSLLTTKNGTVIAAIDRRYHVAGDNPNNIDKSVRLSTDNGDTWSESTVIVDYPGVGRDGSAAIDPSMLLDDENGRVWMIFNHTPGGTGLINSQSGVGFDANGNRLLYDENSNVYTLQNDGSVLDASGNASSYTVNEGGDVYQNNENIGNIYLKTGPLLEARTSFLQAIYSDDHGVSWTKPIELNPEVKEEWMEFIGAAPGRGIQLKKGEKAGRLIFPIYYTNSHSGSTIYASSAVIYSDDHGVTWHRSQSPNDGREFNGNTINSETFTIAAATLTEAQVVELANGNLAMYMRNHSGEKRTAVSISTDQGLTWGAVTYDTTLVDPTCQSSIIKVIEDGNELLIWANPASTSSRVNGTIRLSEDQGQTWAYSKLIKAGSYAYSCLTRLPDGDIGLLYEGAGGNIYFVKFSLDWIRQD